MDQTEQNTEVIDISPEITIDTLKDLQRRYPTSLEPQTPENIEVREENLQNPLDNPLPSGYENVIQNKRFQIALQENNPEEQNLLLITGSGVRNPLELFQRFFDIQKEHNDPETVCFYDYKLKALILQQSKLGIYSRTRTVILQNERTITTKMGALLRTPKSRALDQNSYRVFASSAVNAPTWIDQKDM